MRSPGVQVHVPDWLAGRAAEQPRHQGDEARMRFAVGLARENVLRETGGPFGAAVYESESGRLVSAGVNMVVPGRNSVLHAEIVALMIAHHRVDSYTLRAPGLPAYELVTSCDPCAMCLGAVLWSGVRRVVCGAAREDAQRVGFEEGPVFPESYEYLAERGIEAVHGVAREEAGAVLELYAERNGVIYNA